MRRSGIAALMVGATISSATWGQTPREAVEQGLRGPVIFEGESNQHFSIEESLIRNQTPALSLAVLSAGEIAWSGAYGLADASTGRAAAPSTSFQAGSIAKPVTAAAVLRLAEAGEVDLDASISDYLISYSLPTPQPQETSDNPVTLRSLLSHTAGLAGGGYQGYPPDAPTPSDIEILQGDGAANSPALEIVAAPGQSLVYAGAGYTLVEVALHDALGADFSPLMDRWILDPARMHHSSFDQSSPLEPGADIALGHDTAGAVIDGGWRVHPEQAAAGLWTTAEDLAQMLRGLHLSYAGSGDLLSQETARDLFTEQRDGHAFGWVLRETPTGFFAAHSGGNEGYRAYVILNPETGDGAALLANGNNGMAVIAETVRALSDTYGWARFEPVTVRRAELSIEALEARVGSYHFEGIGDVVIERDGDGLRAIYPNGQGVQMTPITEGGFIQPSDATRLSFSFGDGGARLHIGELAGLRTDE